MVTDNADLENQHTPASGKRHRPLGRMEGVQRSPDKKGGKQQNQDRRQATQTPAAAGPSLSVSTDPPTTEPTPENLLLLSGMRAVLQEELGKTEKRLAGRIAVFESGFEDLKTDVGGLEKRLEQVERRSNIENGAADDPVQWSHSSNSQMEMPVTKMSRYWRARRSLRL